MVTWDANNPNESIVPDASKSNTVLWIAKKRIGPFTNSPVAKTCKFQPPMSQYATAVTAPGKARNTAVGAKELITAAQNVRKGIGNFTRLNVNHRNLQEVQCIAKIVQLHRQEGHQATTTATRKVSQVTRVLSKTVAMKAPSDAADVRKWRTAPSNARKMTGLLIKEFVANRRRKHPHIRLQITMQVMTTLGEKTRKKNL